MLHAELGGGLIEAVDPVGRPVEQTAAKAAGGAIVAQVAVAGAIVVIQPQALVAQAGQCRGALGQIALDFPEPGQAAGFDGVVVVPTLGPDGVLQRR